jgi:Flp pilus assembly protein TadG
MNRTNRHSQRGAVILTVCLVLLFMLGFMGIALDFGRLFIVKTELQTAMDSCALSAAQELDRLADSISRADSAGETASNINRVNMQSGNWDGQAKLTAATGITYRDAAYTVTTVPASATYAVCTHTQPSVHMWLLHILGSVSGNTTAAPDTRSVVASAVAKRSSAQTTCPIPVALKAAAGATPPMYGFVTGQWVTVLEKNAGVGEFGWYNLNVTKDARSTREQLESGLCNTRLGDQLRTPGSKTSVDETWNYRFGIYKNNDDPSVHRPDYSGYSYTAANWKNASPQNAWSGSPAAGSHATAANFVTKRSQYRSFDNLGTDLKDGSLLTFGDKNRMNSFKDVLTPGATGQHHQYGANRRVATVPVLDATNHVIDYLCIFMLHPLSGPNDNAMIEVRENASVPTSPCTTAGLPGGSAGPLVPVLVR